MRTIYLGAAEAMMLALGGCGNLYGDHSGEAYRSDAGFTRENPPRVGPPTNGQATTQPAMSSHPRDVGHNGSQGAPIGGP